jgi:hypothetical protein
VYANLISIKSNTDLALSTIRIFPEAPKKPDAGVPEGPLTASMRRCPPLYRDAAV